MGWLLNHGVPKERVDKPSQGPPGAVHQGGWRSRGAFTGWEEQPRLRRTPTRRAGGATRCAMTRRPLSSGLGPDLVGRHEPWLAGQEP